MNEVENCVDLERSIGGVRIVRGPCFPDERGSFATHFRSAASDYARFPIREVSHSVSKRGVLRGIHYTTTPPGRAKIVYSPIGHTVHFVVDLRTESATFGAWESVVLGGDNADALCVPIGVGHGFLSLRDDSVVGFLMSHPYDREKELSVDSLDPQISLPVDKYISDCVRSERDRLAPTLDESLRRGLLPSQEQCRSADAAHW